MPESRQATNMDRRAAAAVFVRVLLVAGMCSGAAACNRATFVPPAGPGEPAPDAAAAWAEAAPNCGGLKSYSAALRVSGRVGAARLWPVSLEAAVLADESIYLGATAAGRPLFILAGTGSGATLWLRREQRVVTAKPAEIMDAMLGLSVTPADLLGVLTGCVARSLGMKGAARHGTLLTIDTAGGQIHLERRGGRWQIRAAQTAACTVEYAESPVGLPQAMWLWPAANPGVAPAAIHVKISDAQINESVPAGVFRVPAGAAGAAPITLEELKSGAVWKSGDPPPERF
jgi:hypothetical protein